MSLTLCITQTLIKENEDHKPFTEYVINITYNSKTWQIHRRYKLFCTLNDQLRTEFPSVKFPTSSCQFENKSITEIFTRKRSRMIEDRRRVLQEYLIDLSLIPLIRESTTYKKFLGIDEHFPEQFLPYFQIANILGTPGEIVSNTQEILDPDTQLDAVSPDIYEMKKREEIGLESIVNQLDLDASLSPNTDQKIYTHPLPPGDYDHIGNNTYGSPNLHLFTTGGRYPNRLLDIDFMTEEQKVDTMEVLYIYIYCIYILYIYNVYIVYHRYLVDFRVPLKIIITKRRKMSMRRKYPGIRNMSQINLRWGRRGGG